MAEHGELIDPVERARAAILDYHRLPPNDAPGSHAFETYDSLHQRCDGVPLDPAMDVTAAWLELERYFAMPGSISPTTQKRFQAREINAAKTKVTDRLAALSSPDMPLNVRIEAMLAAQSIPYYNKIMSPHPRWPGGNERFSMLQRDHEVVQMTAENIDQLDPELGDIIALFALINEIGIGHGLIALPTPPRQPWVINGFNETPEGIAWAPIDVGDEPRGHVITIGRRDIGNELWASIKEHSGAKAETLSGRYDDLPTGRNATLQALALAKPGIVHDLYDKSGLVARDLQLQVPLRQLLVPLARGILNDLTQGDWYEHFPRQRTRQVQAPAPVEPQPLEPETEPIEEPAPLRPIEPERTTAPEALWYLRQIDGDMDAPTYRLMLINMQNLTEQEEGAESLLPLERYALGWMQREHAERLADAGDSEQAAAYFTVAAQAFARAAEEFMRPPARPGMACEALLAYESTDIYAQVRLGTDPEAIREEVDYYAKRLAMLSQKIREHEAAIATNEEEAAILYACAERTTLALLMLGATEPIPRHFIQPVSPRGVGYRERLVVYPLDAEDNYNTSQPLLTRIVDGQNIHASATGLTVGRALLAPPQDKLGFLEELANVVVPPPEKPAPPTKQPKKKLRGAARKAKLATEEETPRSAPVRTEAADELSNAVAQGIFDAYEAREEAAYLATLSANERKRYLRERNR